MASESSFMFDGGPADFRAQVRALITEKLPPGWMGPFTEDPKDLEISNRFCEELAARGLLVPDWPQQFGGQGLDLARGIVIREEMWAHGEPRGGQYYGPNWVGPSIMRYGTEEQKRQHLPAIASGAVIWCQGFSEPDAGSDLAAMTTRAIPQGDHFVITGQKVWTSWARWAHWCYLLAKVPGTDDPKGGVTVFLIPMDRDGITVRGIDGLPGPHHLNEMFLDGVIAHRSEVLGPVGQGWQVMRDALANERIGIARYARSDRVLALVAPLLPKRTKPAHIAWVQARVRNRISRLACRSGLRRQRDGQLSDLEANATRLLTVRADQLVADVASDLLADRFFEDRYTAGAPFGGMIEFVWRYARAATIASGTTEMLQLHVSRALARGERLASAPEAVEVGDAVTAFVQRAGGFQALRTAVVAPDSRRRLVEPFSALIAGLDPRQDFESALQAAEVCRRAGRVVLPLPVEAMVLTRDGTDVVGLASPGGRVEHGDLFEDWILATGEKSVVRARFDPAVLGTRLGRFVSSGPYTVSGAAQPLSTTELGLAYALPAWFILGGLETALDLAVRYAHDRVQFKAPIATFQAVSFPLADVAAELYGLQRLAEFTLWRVAVRPDEALSDALALRWAALDIARRSLAISHQVLGAIGLTDEHDLSLITSALQPRLRLPLGIDATLDALTDAIDRLGFESIFQPETERSSDVQ